MPELTPAAVFQLLGAFALGSIPFAMISMAGSGVDIRSIGSGNPGFNNVLRYSKWRALICLAGDMGKGIAAVLLFSAADGPVEWKWMLGLAVMLGHCYTPLLGFNGGKGVATALGVMLVLYPRLALASVVIYVVGRVIGKKLKWPEAGAIASLVASALFVVLVLAQEGTRPALYAALLFLIVLWRHKGNVRRMLRSA